MDASDAPDPAVRRALRLQAGEDDGQGRFDPAKLASLSNLSWSDYGEAEAYPDQWITAKRLDGLEQCVSLTELAFAGNAITTLAPLAPLAKLESLWMGDNALRSIASLGPKPALLRLDLHGNPLTSLVGIEACPALQRVDIGQTQVEDLAPLLALPALREVRVHRLSVGSGSAAFEVLMDLRGRGVDVQCDQQLRRTLDDAIAERALRGFQGGVTGAVRELLGELGLSAWALQWQQGGLDEEGRTVLHLAAGMGERHELREQAGRQAELVRALLAEGADPKAVSWGLRTPLMEVMGDLQAGQPLEVVAALIGAGSPLNGPGREPPLVRALEVGSRKADLVTPLVEAGADLSVPEVVVALARHGRRGLLERALDAGADPNALGKEFGTTTTPLIAACAADDADAVKLLLARGADPNVPNRVGKRPVHEVRSAEVLGLLLDAGVDVHPVDHLGQGAMWRAVTSCKSMPWSGDHEAIFEKRWLLIRALAEAGADPNPRKWSGETALHELATGGGGYATLPPFIAKTIALVVELGGDANALAHQKTPRDLPHVPEVVEGLTAVGGVGSAVLFERAMAIDPGALDLGSEVWPAIRGVLAQGWKPTGEARGTLAVRLTELLEDEGDAASLALAKLGDPALAALWLEHRVEARFADGGTHLHALSERWGADAVTFDAAIAALLDAGVSPDVLDACGRPAVALLASRPEVSAGSFARLVTRTNVDVPPWGPALSRLDGDDPALDAKIDAVLSAGPDLVSPPTFQALLRDLFCVLPQWPSDRYLELAPKYWRATRARLDDAELAREVAWFTIPVTPLDIDALRTHPSR